ncbi:DNA cytosine methyltransferase [Winogradskyella flava]|uniref:DNA (cytosine-5-)-methyltransferase n=1 Tax=Winogradskyella flava TaxID=1884876 RepID=A0A842IWM2_9FLAO|nr:DNA cytosine methyltransferase [Winogradskyella flava]MBC2845188.1 DNA cytosine methyltransferase [Winogradskyella flava]
MTKKPLTYISLFSSAGIGCYGFKKNGFECIATNEILAKRLKIQRFNSKCKFDSGYISGDITKREVKQQLLDELELWKETYKILSPDVLIATPPCQGMSVANHKKNNEKSRNSLVVESIKLTNQIRPKYFVFENVRAFLNTICTDIDGIDKPIKEAISVNLGGDYNILSKIVNFKNYGSNSSRTRSLVIGVRKDIKHCSPYDIFPEKSKPKTLRQLIGDLQPLTKMGEISKDIFHAYREFDQRMLPWIETLEEGQSAFENKDSSRIPHRIVNGEIIYNKSKNGDKYARWYWDKEGPCVHTRNDILSSQNTVHPSDNRVFSIRELMRMLSIPESFEWSNIKTEKLNQLSDSEKKAFLKKEELNIRHCLGEAVPTGVFKSIAKNIKRAINEECLTSADLETTKEEFKLNETQSIIDFVEANIKNYELYNVLLITEYAYSEMQDTLKQLTTKDVVYSVINELPELKKKKKIRILEPSVNIGSFIPMLFNKYEEKDEVVLDIYDNNEESMQIFKALLSLIKIPDNSKIHIVNLEEIHMDLTKTYDIILDRKPSLKVTKADVLLKSY